MQFVDQFAVEELEPRFLLANAPMLAYESAGILWGQLDDPVRNLARIRFADTNNAAPGLDYKVQWSPTLTFIDDLAHTLDADFFGHTSEFGDNTWEATQVLDAGQLYYYRAKAVIGANESGWSNVRTSPTASDAVVEVSVAPDQPETEGIKLQWLQRRLAIPVANYDEWTYNVSRKTLGSSTWTPISDPLDQETLEFTDEDVQDGEAYEYQVQRRYDLAPVEEQPFVSEYGYIYAGRKKELVDPSRTVLLVIDETIIDGSLHPNTAPLVIADIAQLKLDLVGERWKVLELIVDRDDDLPDSSSAPNQATSIKSQIASALGSVTGDKSIMLLGHIPVPYSGLFTTAPENPGDPDGHIDEKGAWAADLYYGTGLGTSNSTGGWIDSGTLTNTMRALHNNAANDGRFDATALPGDATIPVGRIDFANLNGMEQTFPDPDGPGVGLDHPPVAEAELLMFHRYMVKDHNWRTGLTTVTRRAMIDTQHDFVQTGVNARRNFTALVGPENVQYQDWEGTLRTNDYLWAYGSGNGNDGSAAGVTNVEYFRSAPEILYKAVFQAITGSYFGDWNSFYNANPTELSGSNLLKSTLGMLGNSLTVNWGLSQHWLYHFMGLGEPIGTSLLTTANNRFVGSSLPLYLPSRDNNTAVFTSLLGDPTLTMSIAKPVSNVRLSYDVETEQVSVTFAKSVEESGGDFLRYELWRSDSLHAEFDVVDTLAGGGGGTDRVFTDEDPGEFVYMVRAVKMEETASGTYENASTGIFATNVTIEGTGDAGLLHVRRYTDAQNQIDAIRTWVFASPTGVPAGAPTFELDYRTTGSITINGNDDDNTLKVDHEFGTPVPSGGVVFDGNGGGEDTLLIRGAPDVTDAVSFGSAAITVDGAAATTNYSEVEHVQFDGRRGADDVTVTSSHSSSLPVEFPETQDLDDLSVAAGRTVMMKQDGANVLIVNDLALAGGSSPTATLDLVDNDMIVTNSSYATITDLIADARNGGSWNQPGIYSSAAYAASPKNKTLGTLTGSTFHSIYTSTTNFSGESVSNGDVLVKFTYYGDADLNGIINFDDYSRIDGGFGTGSTWVAGDFDYNGSVNFDDYSLIDAAYNSQGGLLTGPPGGDGNSRLTEIAQMPHFSQSYMYHFIDWAEQHWGVIYTEEDFFPDGVPW